jgi:hypothetical protein
MKKVNPRRAAARRAAWAALPPEERERRIAALLERNARLRKYAVNEHYFDEIDTPDKAYWLGFIAGDGCTLEDGTLRLNLAPVDIGQLQNLRAALESEAPIRHGTTRLHGKTYKRVILSVYSLHLVQALGRQGIVPRKTWCMEPWDGPADLMRHYWRGLVDADGTIDAVSSFAVRLVGTKPVAVAFGDWIRSVRPSSRIRPKHRQGILWEAGISGRLGAQVVAEALYGDCTAALARKAERAAALLIALPPKGPARDDRSPEAHARRSAFHAGQVPSQANIDARRTPEARERARQRKLGTKDTDETRRNKSESQLRRYEDPAAREKTGRAIREAAERRREARIAAGLEPPPREKICRTCGADISHRPAQSRFCELCTPVKPVRKAAQLRLAEGRLF